MSSSGSIPDRRRPGSEPQCLTVSRNEVLATSEPPGPTRPPAHGPLRSKALVLYAGTRTPHRSCGIALAETFNRPTAAYQSLRRGGITGHGPCGAIVAGQLLLGELLGDPEPTGPVTAALRAGSQTYRERIEREIDRGNSPDLICNHLTAAHGDFTGLPRQRFCTGIVGQVAQIVDEILREHGQSVSASPVQLLDGSRFEPEHTRVTLDEAFAKGSGE